MDYHWDDEKALIILDDEMSEFELADCQSERKKVEYVIGIIISIYKVTKIQRAFWLVKNPWFIVPVNS